MSEDDGAEEVVDSPIGGVAEHIRRYVRTDGASGHMEAGVTNLLLTTRGRKSGKLRRTAVFYGEDDGRFILLASHMSGGPKHPDWYLNLASNPEVRVQVGPEKFRALARTATPEEKPRLWRIMTTLWPGYDNYQASTTRNIPIVILERI